MVEVSNFQLNPNEKTIFLVLQQEERKELAQIHKMKCKAIIKKYREDLQEAIVGKSKSGPHRPSLVYKVGIAPTGVAGE